MDYHLEGVGDEGFQKLCQSILLADYPKLQCLPVNQPDGGRDAFMRPESAGGPFLVFQVKFVRDPQSKQAREIVESVIETEGAKIKRLIALGASHFHLLTNAPGTSHLQGGSIDRVNAALSEAFGIEAYCWWRDDIERRIDIHSSLKWSFPQILRATDLLEALVGSGLDDAQRRSDAIKRYMAHQAKYDSQLKFKQIDLQKSIADLFVDVPARMLLSPTSDVAGRVITKQNVERWSGYTANEISPSSEVDLAKAPGALKLLVRRDFSEEFPRLVIEGAPGQGKSTVTQFLCQVHRAAFLNRTYPSDNIDQKFLPTAARVPFRIDLRDYASWISGKDPFSSEETKLPPGTPMVLESFIAAQVHRATGASFSVDDFIAIASRSQLLIVLDGFDEVADTHLRNKLVQEVSDAATRIEAVAIATQMIVTSRPAAFANSPGFPREEWQHLQILSLSRANIESYAQKWLDGRGVDAREREDVIDVLKLKLEQPHIRDLARNPMQLAILLNLISVQGPSLPDKRTALYERYMEIFLNREADKSPIVQAQRELLVHVLGYLAWVLQVRAEASGAGNISESTLRKLVKEFLEENGQPTDIANELFSGMVERVVALVSRVQGTFEFEVQPLREYFAAKYLYDTAPYSPPGNPRKGTRTDRFDAMARNHYWMNVTRFYAGYYSTGELSSLLIGLQELALSPNLKLLSHPGFLAITLLRDYVFNQQPKVAKRVGEFLCNELSFHLLLACVGERVIGISAPVGIVREQIVTKCRELILSGASDVRRAAAQTMAMNIDTALVVDEWFALRESFHAAEWIELGSFLGVFRHLEDSACKELFTELGGDFFQWVWMAGRIHTLEDHPDVWNTAITTVFSSNSFYVRYFRPGRKESNAEHLFAIALLLTPYLHEGEGDLTLRALFERGAPYQAADDLPCPTKALSERDAKSFAAAEKLLDTKISVLKSQLAEWSGPIEDLRELWGNQPGLDGLAIRAVRFQDSVPRIQADLCDDAVPLVERVAAARSKATDAEWWDTQLKEAYGREEYYTGLVFRSLLSLASEATLLSVGASVSEHLESFSVVRWERFFDSIRAVEVGSKKRSYELKSSDALAGIGSRLACVLLSIRSSLSADVWRAVLSDYRGSDQTVLAVVGNYVVGLAQSGEIAWRQALDLVKHAYEHDVDVWIPHASADEKIVGFTLEEATVICTSPTKYPLAFVQVAESRLAEFAGQMTQKVGDIAEREGWFLEV